jgi:uncharacterized membrane protein
MVEALSERHTRICFSAGSSFLVLVPAVYFACCPIAYVLDTVRVLLQLIVQEWFQFVPVIVRRQYFSFDARTAPFDRIL